MPLSRRDLIAGAIALPSTPAPVLMDQDGGMPDDYLAMALLMTFPNVRPLGVVVTPADCFLEPAVNATRKLLGVMGRTDIHVGASHVEGVHPFPDAWRAGSRTMDTLVKGPLAPLDPEDGPRFLVRKLKESSEPVRLLVTGPLTTIARALDLAPGIARKIAGIAWMGGALNVPGNVDHGPAEWNAYWDPPAAARVWATAIPIVLCPLDITNHVPVTEAFIARLRGQSRYPISKIAAEAYGDALHTGLYFWDVLTASYLGRPELFRLREWETEIVTSGRNAGQTRVRAGARKIHSLDQVNVEAFYDFVLAAWKR